MNRLLQSFWILINDLYIPQKNYMLKGKEIKKKSDKTPPSKSAKEKRQDKQDKKRNKENESRNAAS